MIRLPAEGAFPFIDKHASVLVFLAAFGVYLWTMPPSLPAYRDAGEMASSAYTLGVSHPPSYPVYISAGHAAIDLVPMGSPAYRLTLLSAAASAACLAVLFAMLRARFGFWAAAGAAVLLGADTTFWSVAVVPEMYSLMLLMAAVLWALAWDLSAQYRARRWYAFAFLYGLFLGNRTDLLLWAPGLLWLATRSEEAPFPGRRDFAAAAFRTAGFALAGLSIYLYLPLRSLQGPWLDWNHPATLDNLVGSLTRRGYGGTLDMLSKSYAIGSQFAANLSVYAGHLWRDYLGAGAVLAALGCWSQFRRDRPAWTSAALAYGASGPLFIFLANLPPNPHAMAIVEPHYLLSDMILAVWAAEGLAAFGPLAVRPPPEDPGKDRALAFEGGGDGDGARGFPLGSGRWKALAVIALAVLPWTFGRGFTEPGGQWRRVDRRCLLHDFDYSRNVLRSAPTGAALIAKKDVQLFSLWYHQTVAGRRPDVRVVAQGLSASPWYQNAKRRLEEPVFLGPLRSAEDWRRFAEANGGAFATTDADFPSGLAAGPALGLVVSVSSASVPDETPWRFIVRRGDYRYEDQPDFFHSDLVESMAGARQRLGTFYSSVGRKEDSLRNLYLAWAMKWQAPEAPFFIAFNYYALGRTAEAAAVYAVAIRLFNELLDLTDRYHSLPELADSIKFTAAQAHVNLGAIVEKGGDRAAAERHYRAAIALHPAYDQAHYNLAVLYWGRDWRLSARELELAAGINPANPDYARYLAQARAHLNR